MAANAADPNPYAVVSDDHADESLATDDMGSSKGRRRKLRPRAIPVAELKEHNNSDGSFWAVVDGWVVDATEFVDSHPGGLRKLLSTDSAAAGATGQPYGFSFSRGRNAHFPGTGRAFKEGVARYVGGGDDGSGCLQPEDVVFKGHGKITILGKLDGA